MNMLEKDRTYILNTYNRIDLEIEKIRGNYIYTKDGKEYLDFFSGIAVNNLGYDKDIIDAITDKVYKYTHISNYFVDDDRTELAKIIIENSIEGQVFFTNSGAESSEAAIKLIRKWGNKNNKSKILTAKNSFHGRTMGALSLTGQTKYQQAFEPMIQNIEHFNYNDIEDLEYKVDNDTSSVFIEIVQGESGVIPLNDEFANKLMKLKKKYNFILVIDEIQTGFRRCGTMFAYENYEIIPDIMLLGKAIGGGLPLGAMVVSTNLSHVIGRGDHGSTFGGNPVSCAAGLCLMKKLIDKELVENINKNAEYLMYKLKQLKEKFPLIIQDIRGISMIIGLDVGKYALQIQKYAMENGLLLNITNVSVIRFIPPLSISKEDIDYCVHIMDSAFSNTKQYMN